MQRFGRRPASASEFVRRCREVVTSARFEGRAVLVIGDSATNRRIRIHLLHLWIAAPWKPRAPSLRIVQKFSFKPNCTFRGALIVDATTPPDAVSMLEPGAEKLGVLVRLKASARNWSRMRSLN